MTTPSKPKAKPRVRAKGGSPVGRPPGLASVLLREVEPATATLPAKTVHDVLVYYFRLGGDVAMAAAKAHVARSTVAEWRRDGGRLMAAVEAGQAEVGSLTDHDQALLRFTIAANEAFADAEANALDGVVRLGLGGSGVVKRRTTTVSDATGRIVSTTQMEEEQPPLLAANTYILDRRFHERWNRRRQIEPDAAGDPDVAPLSPLPALLDVLAAMEARARETAGVVAEATGAASG